MLVVLLVIKITTVLLDLIDPKLGRINLLGPQIVCLELPINLSLLLAIRVLDPGDDAARLERAVLCH